MPDAVGCLGAAGGAGGVERILCSRSLSELSKAIATVKGISLISAYGMPKLKRARTKRARSISSRLVPLLLSCLLILLNVLDLI